MTECLNGDDDNQQFTNYRKGNSENYQLSENYVTSIIEDNSGILWIGSAGVNKINIKPKKFKANHPKLGTNTLDRFDVKAFYKDEEDNTWVGTNRMGLFIIDKTGNVVANYRLDNPNNYIDGYDIGCIFRDKRNDIWVGTENSVCRFNFKDKTFSTVLKHNIENTPLDSKFRSISEDNYGNFWIARENYGLYKLNLGTGEFKLFRPDKNRKESISSDKVFKIQVDNEGICWIATYGGGLNKLDVKTETFSPLQV